ncbi:MAG: transcriptional regulator PsdR [Candidatus Abyssubacteria bacterium]
MEIGKELKRIRVSQGMTLEELSNKCGYSKALISRVETGSVSPSLTSLMKMVSSLGLKLHDLFTSIEQTQASVVRKGEGKKFYTEGDSTTEYLTTNVASKKMEPISITAPAGYSTGDKPISHYGEQFFYVLDGKIEVTAGDQTYKLGAGDSVYLAAGTPFIWRNPSKETARLISVVTPPQI